MVAGGNLLDDLYRQHVNLDVGALGCPAQQVKCLIGPAPGGDGVIGWFRDGDGCRTARGDELVDLLSD